MAEQGSKTDIKTSTRVRRVRSLRKALNLTEEELGAVMGISATSVSRRLRGQVPFRESEIAVLARYANTRVEWFER